jgi:hypothetical protein
MEPKSEPSELPERPIAAEDKSARGGTKRKREIDAVAANKVPRTTYAHGHDMRPSPSQLKAAQNTVTRPEASPKPRAKASIKPVY